MRKNKLLFMFIFLVCLIPTIVRATDYAEINGTTVRVRSLPSTSGTILGTYDNGKRFVLKTRETSKDQGGGCESGYWYQIAHGNQTGYVCTAFAIIVSDTPVVITDEAKNQCQADLKAKGFPEPYWNSLCNLKAKYPNWNFNAVQTGYDFAAVVAKESCKNSISTDSRSDYQDTTCGKPYDDGYTGASQTALAYYMNPLNFLDEKNIFMFESNYKNDSLQQYYAGATKKIISPSTYFVGYIPNIYNYIANATSSGVSAPAIAARIKQEMGQGRLGKNYGDAYQSLFSCLSGNYTTRTGNRHPDGSSLNNYYNFYNIAATDGSNVTHKSLIYAKNHGWGGTGNQDNDRQTAVTGGASWIYRNYTNAGQQTIYFNKFNVNPASSSSITSHQYMTNVTAPVSEASMVYSGYQSTGALDKAMTFYIPVYGNLSAGITNFPGGATGDTNNSNTNLAPATMVVSSGYSLVGATITNITSNLSIGDFKGRIQSQGGTVTVFSGSSQVTDGLIGTGMTVKVESSSGTAEFTAVVKGDPSGDGKVNALDLLQVQKYILGLKKMSGAYLLASDTSGDGKVTALDLLQIQKKILGLKEL